MGRRSVVTAGHYLAAAAGFRIMEQGGNAIDAAAAMCFCLNVLEPGDCGLGGEVPILVYSAREEQVFAISGVGWSPRALTIEWCRQQGIDLIPGDGYVPACVPAVVDTWAVALMRFGTMSFAQVLQPAIELARDGFPVYKDLHAFLKTHASKFAEHYPTTRTIYCPDGRVPQVGEFLPNPELANTFEILCRAEAGAKHRGRAAGIRAARDSFYKGEIAERICAFLASNPTQDASGAVHRGLLSYDDMAEWQACVEEPLSIDYRGLDVHKCSSWTQGPVFLQQLAILEGFDLQELGHNTADYLHTWVESAKLAFADREAYYGDPLFDDVPFEKLLSEEYARQRRGLIGATASLELRAGNVGLGVPTHASLDVLADNRRALGLPGRDCCERECGWGHTGDTTQLNAMDREGNMVAATPSGGWIQSSPVIEGLGFALGTRGQMFYLNARRPNALEPRKRPRATLTPTMVTRGGQPLMAFGTPGGDTQDQLTLQFFLNCVEFEMDIQEALDAPTLYSTHVPSSFYPRTAQPGQVMVEEGIPPETVAELERRGHEAVRQGRWEQGKVMGICYDQERGVIIGGASAKGNHVAYALGW